MCLVAIATKDRTLLLSHSILTIICHFNQSIHHTLSHHCIAMSFVSAAVRPPTHQVSKYGTESRNFT